MAAAPPLDFASAPAGAQQTDFSPEIEGFAVGDVLRLEGFGNFTAIDTASPIYDAPTNTTALVLTNGGVPVAELELAGDYGGDTFTVTTDLKMANAVDVAFRFMPGILIRTEGRLLRCRIRGQRRIGKCHGRSASSEPNELHF
jgi:hypothetical protein